MQQMKDSRQRSPSIDVRPVDGRFLPIRQFLQEHSVQHCLAAGSSLKSEEATSYPIYLVLAGRLRVTAVSPNGTWCTLDVLQSGNTFSFSTKDSDWTTAWIAQSLRDDTTVAELSEASLTFLVHTHPVVALTIIAEQRRCLTQAYARLGDLAGASLHVRLARTLSRLAQEHGTVVDMSHEELGWLVGASRARVTAALADLRRCGLVQGAAHQRRIRVLDADALSRYSE